MKKEDVGLLVMKIAQKQAMIKVMLIRLQKQIRLDTKYVTTITTLCVQQIQSSECSVH